MKKIFLMLIILALSNCGVVALFVPSIGVMIEEQHGKAEYARAESTRKIVRLGSAMLICLAKANNG